MGGGMEAHKNKWIEDWGTARENLEHNFRWTRRNLALVGIFGIAVPVLIYKGIVREFVKIDLMVFSELFVAPSARNDNHSESNFIPATKQSYSLNCQRH
ncbi:hypothetical protein RJ641_027790 [Dillenia turbinata]|uniref:Uncharacterized protein n=1 Tax=Dillenia turbinata TaxID=194707 RepID=A0AAN8VWW9_9MAGN